MAEVVKLPKISIVNLLYAKVPADEIEEGIPAKPDINSTADIG